MVSSKTISLASSSWYATTAFVLHAKDHRLHSQERRQEDRNLHHFAMFLQRHCGAMSSRRVNEGEIVGELRSLDNCCMQRCCKQGLHCNTQATPERQPVWCRGLLYAGGGRRRGSCRVCPNPMRAVHSRAQVYVPLSNRFLCRLPVKHPATHCTTTYYASRVGGLLSRISVMLPALAG